LRVSKRIYAESREQGGDKQREERWDYPLEALREIVVNMIVHRDHMASSDSMIKIFDDRIEFFNPGCLMEGLSIKQLVRGNYISAIRNKQIASLQRSWHY
jgi:ATP-dependent DNA helicase RecG